MFGEKIMDEKKKPMVLQESMRWFWMGRVVGRNGHPKSKPGEI